MDWEGLEMSEAAEKMKLSLSITQETTRAHDVF